MWMAQQALGGQDDGDMFFLAQQGETICLPFREKVRPLRNPLELFLGELPENKLGRDGLIWQRNPRHGRKVTGFGLDDK